MAAPGPRALSDAPTTVARTAGLPDLPVLLDQMRAFYAEDRLSFDAGQATAAVAALLAAPDLGTILLLGDDAACGYVVLTRGFSLEQGGAFVLVDELFIAPHARGRGLGAAALEHAAAQARDWGIARLRLEVNHHNPRAKALYLRAGFRDDQRDTLTLESGLSVSREHLHK